MWAKALDMHSEKCFVANALWLENEKWTIFAFDPTMLKISLR
jgi:hypothetical protein